MLFSSTVFLFLFLPCVLATYYVTPRRGKNSVLIAASLFFYFWGETFFVLVMLLSIISNYAFGIWVDRAKKRSTAKLIVGLAVVLNLGLLVLYKYDDFIVRNLNAILALFGIDPVEHAESTVLPIGISFFTFQAMSYVIDVYRGDARALKDISRLALFISMFPQLIAGPILRYREIEAQLIERRVTLSGLQIGVRRFVIGLGKKVLLAAPLSGPADLIFDGSPVGELSPAVLWLGAVCYMFQLYFDFSGYSDMAVGLGHMLGFKLPENFNYPFVARSVRDLWRRWHMTLTRWFREYVYIPMGGNRVSSGRVYFNLVSVFVLVGLWHGSRWTFIVFGLYHGLFLVFERFDWARRLERSPRVFQHGYTMLVWILGLVIFRSNSLPHAGEYLVRMCGFGGAPGMYQLRDFLDRELVLILPIALVASLPLWRGLGERLSAPGTPARGAYGVASVLGMASVFFLSVVTLASTTQQAFIYFRF